jgi:Ca2+-binding RTX toxin-like protein
MALTNFHTDWEQGTYEADRNHSIKIAENDELLGGNLIYLKPYPDKTARNGAGSIAIGYGFDLLAHSNPEINDYLIAADLPTLSDHDKQLLDLYRVECPNLELAASQLELDLGSEENASELLDAYIDLKAEVTVTNFLASIGLTWGQSKERAALVSLAYNSSALLGSGLKAALGNGNPELANRAEAWYEIRYRSNSDGAHATRRYSESKLFGLYDGTGTPSFADAEQAYRMFTLHRDRILSYEANPKYTPPADNHIRDALAKALDVILADLSSSSNSDIAAAYAKWAADDNSFTAANLYLEPVSDHFHSVLDARGHQGDDNNILIGKGDASGNGGDMLLGGRGNDLLIGGTGDDYLEGGGGEDVLAGGQGNDTYKITGDQEDVITIEDKSGNDKIVFNGKSLSLSKFEQQTGGSYIREDGLFTAVLQGGDLVVTDEATGAQLILNDNFESGDFGIYLVDPEEPEVPVNQITGNNYSNRILGPDEDPYLDPGISPSVEDRALYGTALDNYIQALDGNDDVYAGDGDDWIEGGEGRDGVSGGLGDDVIEGGAGYDILAGNAGDDQIYADELIDVADAIAAGSGSGAGQQGESLAGEAGQDIVIGGSGNDLITGGADEDTLVGGAGDDDIHGDATYIAHDRTWQLVIEGGVHTYISVDGDASSDNDANDIIYAGSGNDTVWGGGGDDVIYGEGDDDALMGEAGNDIVDGGEGNDSLWGDSAATGGESVTGNDLLIGGTGNDTLYGRGGNDTLLGGTENDTLYGDQTEVPAELHGDDYLDGGEGDDYLRGYGGNDGRAQFPSATFCGENVAWEDTTNN